MIRLSGLRDAKVRTLDGETLGRVHEVHCETAASSRYVRARQLRRAAYRQEARSPHPVGSSRVSPRRGSRHARPAAAKSPATSSAISKPARHSATQRAAVKALRSVGSSGGSHSVRSITRTRGSAASRDRAEEIMHRHAARPRAGRAGQLRAIDHVDVAIDHDRLAMSDMRRAPGRSRARSRRADLADGDDEVSGRHRVLGASCGVLAKPAKPDLRDIGAGQPILDQRAHRVTVAQAVIVSRMSKWASRVISPTLSSGRPRPSTPAG